MVEVVNGRPSVPAWISSRLSEAPVTSEGDRDLNQYLPNNGQTVTNPVKTTHSVFQKGTQRRHG